MLQLRAVRPGRKGRSTPVKWNLQLSSAVADRVDAYLYNPDYKQVPYGAWRELVSRLLQTWLETDPGFAWGEGTRRSRPRALNAAPATQRRCVVLPKDLANLVALRCARADGAGTIYGFRSHLVEHLLRQWLTTQETSNDRSHLST